MNVFTRLFLAFVIIAVCAPPHHGIAGDQASIGINAISLRNWPPYYSINAKTGTPEGFAIDIMTTVAELSHLKIRYTVYENWPEAHAAIKKNEAILIPNIGITDERHAVYDFTRPYETFHIVIFVRSATVDINDIDDLAVKRVGVVEMNQGLQLMRGKTGIDLQTYGSMEEAFMELLSGNIDALVYPEQPIISMALRSGLDDKIKVIGKPLQEIKRGIAVKKGHPELLKKLDDAVARLIKSPEYKSIYEKWHGRPMPFWNLSRIVMLLGFVVGLTTVGMMIWRYRSMLALHQALSETVDELRKAEQAIRESEANYSDLYDNAPDMYLSFDTEGTILKCNRTFNRISGHHPVDIIGKPFIDLFHADNREMAKDVLQSFVKTGEVHDAELELKHKNGNKLFVSLNASAICDGDGHIVHSRAILRDIAARKQAETAIRESEERLKFVLDGSQLGFWDWDITTGEVYRNEYWATMLGYTLQEIEDSVKQWTDLHHPDDRAAAWQSIQDHLDGRTAAHKIEYRMHTKDGHYKWILDQAKVVSRDPQGKPLRMSGTHTDMTDRKKIEGQLRQAQKMEAIGTLAGGIAHDFNNMLGVITGNASYALTRLEKNHELCEVLGDILKSSNQAQNLTQQLLTFSKGGVPIKTVSDINRLITESAIFSMRGAKSNCQFDLPSDLWTAEVDEGQINQVIGNLVINANQAMPNGGMITIKTENTFVGPEDNLPIPDGKYVRIIVEDQGVGISERHLSRIFDPYFSTKQQGSGLGLATTYSIIKKHSGHITVQSAIDKGTTFFIYLPASMKGIEQSKSIEDRSHQGQGKILVMDDQEPILKMAGRMLTRMGYDTVCANDGEQAIALYREAHESGKTFDAVILDLTIPGGLGGAETITELRTIDPNVKAIVSSGYSNDPIMANYRDYGFCGVVQKPYTRDQLADALNRVFG